MFTRHNQVVTIWWARLSFPHIWEPRPIMRQGRPIGDPRYSCQIVLDPQVHAEQIQKIQRIQADLIRKSWNPPSNVPVNSVLKEGSKARPGDPNVVGKLLISANAKADSPPQVYVKNESGINVLTNDRSLIYSGCEAHVNVGLFTDDTSTPQVCAGLNILIPTGRAFPRFDNRPTVESMYEGDEPPPPPPAESPEAPDYPQTQQSGHDAYDPEKYDWM